MSAKPRYFLTTAIDYPNSRPHIGTAFEKIGADVQARYRRMSERVLITTHGEYPLCRAYYYCASCRSGLAPFDRQLGLDAGATTPLLRLLIVEYCAFSRLVPLASPRYTAPEPGPLRRLIRYRSTPREPL